MSCGIYRIRNTGDGKSYIGSSIDIEARFRKHIVTLKRGCHHNTHLQRAYDRDGLDSFEFSILEYCGADNLERREQYHLDGHGACDEGYNIAPQAYSNKGVKHTAEAKEKIRQASSGCVFSKLHKQRIAEALRTYQRTDKHSRNISLGKKGKPSSFQGKCQPESAKAKLREHALKRRIRRNEKGQIVGYDTDAAAI